ncbi:MAG: RpiB/LacA/LacB family sugar-phosphate isomerase [Holosporales bacterium]|jgi:RpiB/LacA/LacB family sugar-phosphate isomerase|nr:RpiB/LacA/LacB family sugar-phosphate isomerase [Holosporales bacterium]
MEGDPARRTGVYFGVHEDLSTGSTQQKADYGEMRNRSAFGCLAIASDHRGYRLKRDLIEHFRSTGYNVEDFGTDSDCISVDYPDYAKKVAHSVLNSNDCFGILICYSGIGMNIAANRVRGIRSVWCPTGDAWEEIMRLAREHNDANIICFGSKFTTPEQAIKCATVFVDTEFSDNRHLIRINKIDEI